MFLYYLYASNPIILIVASYHFGSFLSHQRVESLVSAYAILDQLLQLHQAVSRNRRSRPYKSDPTALIYAVQFVQFLMFDLICLF
jgi:hypothetical protein